MSKIGINHLTVVPTNYDQTDEEDQTDEDP